MKLCEAISIKAICTVETFLVFIVFTLLSGYHNDSFLYQFMRLILPADFKSSFQKQKNAVQKWTLNGTLHVPYIFCLANVILEILSCNSAFVANFNVPNNLQNFKTVA